MFEFIILLKRVGNEFIGFEVPLLFYMYKVSRSVVGNWKML